MKYLALKIFFVLVFIPFILMNDFFPFFRFGMFAEKISTSTQTEEFSVYAIDSKGNQQLFQPEQIGFDKGHFSYIIRNYVYRNEGKELLKKINSIVNSDGKTQGWILQKITNQQDTTLLLKWNPDEDTEQ